MTGFGWGVIVGLGIALMAGFPLGVLIGTARLADSVLGEKIEE